MVSGRVVDPCVLFPGTVEMQLFMKVVTLQQSEPCVHVYHLICDLYVPGLEVDRDQLHAYSVTSATCLTFMTLTTAPSRPCQIVRPQPHIMETASLCDPTVTSVNVSSFQ